MTMMTWRLFWTPREYQQGHEWATSLNISRDSRVKMDFAKRKRKVGKVLSSSHQFDWWLFYSDHTIQKLLWNIFLFSFTNLSSNRGLTIFSSFTTFTIHFKASFHSHRKQWKLRRGLNEKNIFSNFHWNIFFIIFIFISISIVSECENIKNSLNSSSWKGGERMKNSFFSNSCNSFFIPTNFLNGRKKSFLLYLSQFSFSFPGIILILLRVELKAGETISFCWKEIARETRWHNYIQLSAHSHGEKKKVDDHWNPLTKLLNSLLMNWRIRSNEGMIQGWSQTTRRNSM